MPWPKMSHSAWSEMGRQCIVRILQKNRFSCIFSTMGRSYRRKTEKVSETAMENAMEAVRNGTNVRTAARQFNVPRATLQRRMKTPLKPKRGMQIFTGEQEIALEKYLVRSAAMYYGKKATCALAYQYAKVLSIKIPRSWEVSKCAGIEWLRSFRKRHSDLTLRRPQSTSMARTTAFNEFEFVEVGTFDFDQTLKDIAPFPKMPPRKVSSKGRKKRKAAILTDDVVMEELREEQRVIDENTQYTRNN